MKQKEELAQKMIVKNPEVKSLMEVLKLKINPRSNG